MYLIYYTAPYCHGLISLILNILKYINKIIIYKNRQGEKKSVHLKCYYPWHTVQTLFPFHKVES